MDDDGYVNIVGRIKDMIIRGGENVYPREIEEFLYGHPDIVDVQVIGVPDARYGEELMAWVRLREGATITVEDVAEFCRGKIAHYKVPRYVHVTDEFPMTVTGKVQKYKMRRAPHRSRPRTGGRAVRPSYERGMLTNGPLVRAFEEQAAERLGVPHVVAVSSCTAGLMLVLRVLAPKGPVVLPSFTFSASAHAIAWNGLEPRFVECDPASFQVDTDSVVGRLAGAGAVLATHVFGSPCDVETLEAIAAGAGIPLVFDAAHAFGAFARGRRSGVRRRRGVQPQPDEGRRRRRGRPRRDQRRRARRAAAHRTRLRQPRRLRHPVRRAQRADVGAPRRDRARVAGRPRRRGSSSGAGSSIGTATVSPSCRVSPLSTSTPAIARRTRTSRSPSTKPRSASPATWS